MLVGKSSFRIRILVPRRTSREWAGIVLVTSAIVAMLVAWRWELAGALLSLAALGAFVVMVRMSNHAVVAVVASPGLLFAAGWVLRRWLLNRNTATQPEGSIDK
jgi:hypothetical protein